MLCVLEKLEKAIRSRTTQVADDLVEQVLE